MHNSNLKKKNNYRKIILISLFLISLLFSGCGSKKEYRVGILHVPGAFNLIRDGFKAKMIKLGYIEGKNIVYVDIEEPLTATQDEVKLLAKKLVDDKVDLILAYPTPPTIGAYAATQGTNIPVVFAVFNVEGSKLIKSVREPGGNMTGVRNPSPEIISKRLKILHEIAPQIKRVWVGYDKNHPNTSLGLEALRLAAADLGIKLVEVPAAILGELQADLTARVKLTDPGFDAIVTMSDGMNQGPEGFAMLKKFAAERKMPLCAGVRSMVQEGAVFANAPDMFNVGELSALLADKIFKGTPAGTIPILTPEQELYINYKEAQRIGLKVPETLLLQAKEVIRQ